MSKKEKTNERPKETKDQKNLEEIKKKGHQVYFDADIREVKTLKEIFDKTTEVQEIFIPILGCCVKVGHISMKDFTKLTEKLDPKNPKDQIPLAMEMVYHLMKSADSTVTREIVFGMPYHIATEIIKATTGGDTTGFQGESTLPTVQQDT